MTNLEWIVKSQYDLRVWLCELVYFAKNCRHCDFACKDCEFRVNKRVLEVLNEEHKEKNDEQV